MPEQVERIEWAWCCHASWRCLGIGVPGVIRNGVMLCEQCDAQDSQKIPANLCVDEQSHSKMVTDNK